MAKETTTPTPADIVEDIAPVAPVAAPKSVDSNTYVVQDGDTWASLGAKFGKGYATAVALMELNGGKQLVPGDEIKVK